MATARPLVLSSNDVQAAREILNNLTIAENPSSWQVASSFEGKEISTEVPKDQFSFYATKRDTFYEVAPAVKNRSSALKVLNELFLKTNIDLGLSPKIERKRIASVPIPLISLALLFSSSVLNYVFNSKSLLSSLPAALAIALSSRIFVLGLKGGCFF
ncbi:MAG: hypothetical protein NTX12_01020 [Actinobacteria bacterium]|nr:hypothetical protein [Actinomycetota bacterium]